MEMNQEFQLFLKEFHCLFGNVYKHVIAATDVSLALEATLSLIKFMFSVVPTDENVILPQFLHMVEFEFSVQRSRSQACMLYFFVCRL